MEYRPEQDSEYFGTGRRPEHQSSHPGLTTVLLLTLLSINFLHLAVVRTRQEEQPATPATETLYSDSYRVPELTGQEGETALPGLYLSDMDEAQRLYLSLPEGVAVTQVEAESSAYASGLRSGDIITAVKPAADDTQSIPVPDLATFRATLSQYRAQGTVYLVCARNDGYIIVAVSPGDFFQS